MELFNHHSMHRVFWVLCIIAYSLPVLSQQGRNMEKLKKDILEELGKQPGEFAVAFKDLSSGKELLINEKENFHAASTMKVPVMIEVFKQAGQGKFKMTDYLVLRNEFKSIVDSSFFSLDSTDDSEKELYKHIGEKRSIHDLLYQMIIVSSNFATDLIVEKVGAGNVMQTMQELGAKDIRVLRGVEDQKAFDRGLNNTTTAFDLALLFEKIARGKVISKKACQSMTGILLDQKFNEVIPALLPPAVKVAHKTGSLTGVHHDAGIVFLPDGRKYVLVLLSRNLKDEDAAVKAMAKVSEMIYQYANR
jgi:beta-lactamase class A